MLKLYGKYAAARLKSMMEYKASFLMMTLTQFLLAFTTLLSINFLMRRFGAVGGFTYEEVLICYAASNFSFAFAECFFRGFDTFSSLIGNGGFDRIMVRPRNEIFQIVASQIEFSKLGRMFTALAILVYALGVSGISWNVGRVLVLAFMLAGGVAFFTGLFIIYASICFFTLEGLEFMNIFTDGGRELGKYPLSIYGKGILTFFTCVLPFACAQYYPFLFLCGKSDSLLCALSPAACFVFLLPCYAFWRFGLRHYKSTGS